LLLLGLAACNTASAQENIIEIAVSPSTLNLQSNGGCVTVHAVVAYRAVTGAGLYVEGAQVGDIVTFPDSRGELVVRCSIETVKSMVSVGTARFDLVVQTGSGTYTGTDTITVISRGK
jgi:hypothetical protein